MLGADGRRLCTGPPQSGRKQESKAQRHLTRAALQQQEQQHRIEYCRSAVFHSKRAKNLRVHAEQDDGQQPANASQEYVDEQGRRIVGGSGSQLVYIGQGRWKWADLENYPSPGKELGGLTGGWPGGELAFKDPPMEMRQGQRVRVRGGGIQRWMRNPLFAASTLGYGGKLGRVVRSEVNNGTTRVAVMLDADSPPAQEPNTDTTEWSKTVIFEKRDLEPLE